MSAKVPEGMLKAAVAAAIEAGKSMNRRQWTEFFSGADGNGVKAARAIALAILLWHRKNARIWTSRESSDARGALLHTDATTKESVAFEKGALWAWEWARNMYDAPEPIPFNTPFGRFVVDDRVPPGEIRLHDWTGPTLIRNIRVEPEAPEEISDLLLLETTTGMPDGVNIDYFRKAVVEAFNRGQKSK